MQVTLLAKFSEKHVILYHFVRSLSTRALPLALKKGNKKGLSAIVYDSKSFYDVDPILTACSGTHTPSLA